MNEHVTDPRLLAGNRRRLADHRPTLFLWDLKDGVGTNTLNREERKNPLTFDSYTRASSPRT